VCESSLRVYEICLTIQGESTYAGRPCVLVRLAGCPLACRYCDTPEARSFAAGREYTVADLVEEVAALGCPLVEITGGEPLVQRPTPELARRLLDRGFEVLVETCGTYPIDVLPAEVVKIVDVKCPGSGESARNDWANIERLAPRDQLKFVITDRADYEWARSVVAQRRLLDRCEVLFSPAFGLLEPRLLAEWIIADRLPVRFQIQLHKYIWGPDAKGV